MRFVLEEHSSYCIVWEILGDSVSVTLRPWGMKPFCTGDAATKVKGT